MSEQGQARKEQYQRVRSSFDDLSTEDKFVFLLEAAVSTFARGVDEVGRAVSDEINKAFRRRAERKSRMDEDEPAPGPSPTTSTPGPMDSGTNGPQSDLP